MNKKIGIILVIFSLLAIISALFDSQIVVGISQIQNNFLDDIFFGITFVSSEIIIFFVLTSLFLWTEHKRKWIFPLWLTLGLSAIISFVMKFSIRRARPFQLGIVSILPSLESASYSVWNFSFPSFQSMLVFSAIPILSKEFPRLKYYWIAFAGLVAFSRVYFGLHFMSDVLVGGLIGYLIGLAVVKLQDKNNFGEKIYRKIMMRKN